MLAYRHACQGVLASHKMRHADRPRVRRRRLIYLMLEFVLPQREYDEESELHRYVWCNYRHAITEREKALHRAAIIELKAENAPHLRDGTPGHFYDADVAAIVECGLIAFEEQCCKHLLRHFADEIFINRCGRCNRIVASPIACTCLWCGHSWYERRPEMVARAASPIYPRPQ